MFFNQVQRIPFEDHDPTLMAEMIHFCREASKWLLRDAAHVVNVHCKGGKGRTGIMIAELLLWIGHRKCAMDAMELFTFRRTENYDSDVGIDEGVENFSVGGGKKKKSQPNRGVDGPSQQRHLFYWRRCCTGEYSLTTLGRLFSKRSTSPLAQHKKRSSGGYQSQSNVSGLSSMTYSFMTTRVLGKAS